MRIAARPPTDIHLTFVATCVRDSWEALVLSHFHELFSVPSVSGVMTRVLGDYKVRNTLFGCFVKQGNRINIPLIIKIIKDIQSLL